MQQRYRSLARVGTARPLPEASTAHLLHRAQRAMLVTIRRAQRSRACAAADPSAAARSSAHYIEKAAPNTMDVARCSRERHQSPSRADDHGRIDPPPITCIPPPSRSCLQPSPRACGHALMDVHPHMSPTPARDAAPESRPPLSPPPPHTRTHPVRPPSVRERLPSSPPPSRQPRDGAEAALMITSSVPSAWLARGRGCSTSSTTPPASRRRLAASCSSACT